MKITFDTPGKVLAGVEIWGDCTFEPTSAPVAITTITVGPTTSQPTQTSIPPTAPPTTLGPSNKPTTASPIIPPTTAPTICVSDFVIGFNRDGSNTPLFPGDKIDFSVIFNTVRFRATKAGDADSSFDDGMLLDTRAPPYGSGLALIVSADGNKTHPVAAAGEIWADFAKEVTVVSLQVINDSGTTLELYDRFGTLVKTTSKPQFVEDNMARYAPYAEYIKRTKVTFKNPGSALDEVDIWRHCNDFPTPVPKTPAPSFVPTPSPSFEPTTMTPTLAPSSTEPTPEPSTSMLPSSHTHPSSLPTAKPTFAPTVCEEDYAIAFTKTAHGDRLVHGDHIGEAVPFNAASFRARGAGSGNAYNNAYIFDAGQPNGNVLIISENPNVAPIKS